MIVHYNNYIIIILTCIVTVSCNGQKNEKNSKSGIVINDKKNEMIDNKLKNIIELELSKGFSTSNSQGESPNFEIDEDYFNLTIPILKDSLRKNNYTFNKNSFETQINKIFGERKTNNIVEHISFYDKCKKDESPYMTWEGGDLYNYHILNNEYFVTQTYHIPQILDYQKEYPNIAKIEDTIKIRYPDDFDINEEIEITRWKDIPDLDKQRKFNIQLLVNRNLYLFNDDKSRLPWLLKNDEYFMRSLVLTFGW
ncbi:MAG: hypothetical protein ACK5IC_00510, partial [Moheibacter sp.]